MFWTSVAKSRREASGENPWRNFSGTKVMIQRKSNSLLKGVEKKRGQTMNWAPEEEMLVRRSCETSTEKESTSQDSIGHYPFHTVSTVHIISSRSENNLRAAFSVHRSTHNFCLLYIPDPTLKSWPLIMMKLIALKKKPLGDLSAALNQRI